MKRRGFIKSLGFIGGAIAFKIYLPNSELNAATGTDVKNWNPWMFISVSKDNRIEIAPFAQEIGQGTTTGIAMLFAEELEADWQLVSIRPSSSDHATRTFLASQSWGGGVGGSGTAIRSWSAMREAGATARQMFLAAAARNWNVNISECRIENSIVIGPDSQSATLGELAEEAAKSEVPSEVTLKPASEFKIIGKPRSNLYQQNHVTGSLEYTIDLRLPGMTYAAIERCPVYRGKVKSFDATRARAMPGVLDIFEIPEFVDDQTSSDSRAGVAVIANSTWSAFEAKKALSIDWDLGPLASKSLKTIKDEIAGKQLEDFILLEEWGDVETVFSHAENIVEAEYTSHFQEHGLMEPMVAVAHLHDGDLEVWAPTQSQGITAEGVASVSGIASENITIHLKPAGGSFGRKYSRDYTNEVAYIATKVNAPVKLTWTREDCTQMGHYHPYTHFKVKAAIGEDGSITALSSHLYKAFRRVFPTGIPYRISNMKRHGCLLEMPVESGAWRSVFEHTDTFVIEGLIDEIAKKLSKDPLEYRLEQLQQPENLEEGDWRYLMTRARRVLEEVRSLSNWHEPVGPNQGKGVALGRFNNTLVAQVAIVTATEMGPKVDKVYCVADSGTVLNPQLASGQLEGAILWGITAIQHGGIELENGRVHQSNYHDNPLLRIDEVPEIEIRLLESDGPIGGFGEPGVPPLAPAVYNAYFAASGKRIRTIPARWDQQA